MIYRLMGWMHMQLARASADERGQGTVEYVALIMLVALLLFGILTVTRTMRGTDGIPSAISKQITNAINKVSDIK